MKTLRIAIALAALLASGCATVPRVSDENSGCRDFLAALDARIDAAGVRDGGAHRIDGFAYLRADRFLASFADEVESPPRFAAWIEALRVRDMASRRAELVNLDPVQGPALAARADACGRRLAAVDPLPASVRAPLRARSQVPDDYSPTARVLGVYPLAAPLLNKGIAEFQNDVRADYAQPLDALDAPGALAVWTAESRVPEFAAARTPFRLDALGIPQPDAQQWQALLQRHAPTWWIEQNGDYDRPGAPVLDARNRPGVDTAQPTVYYLTGHTRLGQRVLPVLVYVAWFSERPARHPLDPYSGRLDGVLWRVVLDERGAPLLYDTVHSCGCYRYEFPVQPLQPLTPAAGDEPPLLPQAQVPTGAVAVRLQSATHFVRRVVPARSAHGSAQSYRLAPYESLLSLPRADGTRRSLFADHGIVPGTARLERWWLWPSGVRSPGAMRQWGRQATAFVGQRHFDDARFLEQIFEVPEWARAAPGG